MMSNEKVIAFLQKAAELRPAASRGVLAAEAVVAQLAWPAADDRYFQDDAENLLRDLEYQGFIVIWEEDRSGAEAGRPWGSRATFQITDKGLAHARRG